MAPELRLEEVRFRVYRDARLAARGTAARAIYRRDTGDWGAETVEAFLAGGAGSPAWVRLEAARAAGNPRTRDLSAGGGVRVERGEEVARSEEARYDPTDRLVHGDTAVVLTGPDYALGGPTWALDPAAGDIRVRGGAHLAAGGDGGR